MEYKYALPKRQWIINAQSLVDEQFKYAIGKLITPRAGARKITDVVNCYISVQYFSLFGNKH